MSAWNQWASTKHQRKVLSFSSSSSSSSFSSSSPPPSAWLMSTRRPLCQLGRPLLTEQMHAGTELTGTQHSHIVQGGWPGGCVGVGGGLGLICSEGIQGGLEDRNMLCNPPPSPQNYPPLNGIKMEVLDGASISGMELGWPWVLDQREEAGGGSKDGQTSRKYHHGVKLSHNAPVCV